MHPFVGRDLALRRQLDHMHRWFVAARAAGSASKRSFELPDRGIARAPDRIKGYAGAGLTAVAFDFYPTVAAVETLRDRRQGLRWAAAPERGIDSVALRSARRLGCIAAGRSIARVHSNCLKSRRPLKRRVEHISPSVRNRSILTSELQTP